MKKVKLISFLSFFLPLFIFLFLFSGYISLYKMINLYPLKHAFSDISGTFCSIKCLRTTALIPFLFENLKILAISFLTSSLIYGIFKTIRRIYKTEKFLNKIKKEAKPSAKYGINVNIFPHNLPLAFTAGFFKPEIYLSTSLTQFLNEKEIKGIVFHEIHHKKALHPLKSLIISFISDSLFFLPVSKLFKKLYLFCNEIFGDMNSISNGLTKEEIALSFLKVCKIRNMESSRFSNEPIERIKFLFDGKIKIIFSVKKLIISIVVLILLTVITLSSMEKEKFNPFLQHKQVCSYHR